MKKILFLLLLLPFFGIAQKYKDPTLEGVRERRLRGDSVFQIPIGLDGSNNGLRTKVTYPSLPHEYDTAQIRYVIGDSSVRVWTGFQWLEVGGGETDKNWAEDDLTLTGDRFHNIGANYIEYLIGAEGDSYINMNGFPTTRSKNEHFQSANDLYVTDFTTTAGNSSSQQILGSTGGGGNQYFNAQSNSARQLGQIANYRNVSGVWLDMMNQFYNDGNNNTSHIKWHRELWTGAGPFTSGSMKIDSQGVSLRTTLTTGSNPSDYKGLVVRSTQNIRFENYPSTRNEGLTQKALFIQNSSGDVIYGTIDTTFFGTHTYIEALVAGVGGVAGWDDVLAVGQNISADRTVGFSANTLSWTGTVAISENLFHIQNNGGGTAVKIDGNGNSPTLAIGYTGTASAAMLSTTTRSGGGAGIFEVNNSGTNNEVEGINIRRVTTSTAATNFAINTTFTLEGDDGSSYTSNKIISEWTNADAPSNHDSRIRFVGLLNGSPQDIFAIEGSGQAQLHQYTSNFLAGDTTNYKPLVVNSSGQIFRHAYWPAGGAGGSTALSAITAGVASNTINSGNNDQTWQWNSLGGKTAMMFEANTTAAAAGQILTHFKLHGANATSGLSTTTMFIENNHSGTTSTNTALLVSAINGTTANYAIWSDAGINHFEGAIELGTVSNDDTETKLLTWNSTSKQVEYRDVSSLAGSGTVNPGAALKAAYYPSAAALVDDWIGVEFGNTNLNTKITAQASTEVAFEIKQATTPSANVLDISTSAGTGDLWRLTAAGEWIAAGNSDLGGYDIQTNKPIFIGNVPASSPGISVDDGEDLTDNMQLAYNNGSSWNIYTPNRGLTLETGNHAILMRPKFQTVAQFFSGTGVANYFTSGVNGDATVIARMKSGQTADVLLVEDASTNDLFKVTSAGNTEVAGTLLVGSIAQDDAETKVVVWNSTDKIFEWRDASTLGGGSSTFAALTDVNLTSLATNDFLKWDGTDWINRTPTNVKTDLSLNNVDNTSDATKNSATATLTNKRVTKRAPTVTQSATPTINTDVTDVAHITGLAQAITSMTTNLTGTPVEGDVLRIDITDNGTARAITWGTSFEASTVPLPTTTVVSTRLDMVFVWNSVTSKWRIVGAQ